MKKNLILWVSTIALVFLIGYVNALTDPDYPASGTIYFDDVLVSYYFEKISDDGEDYTFFLQTADDSLDGFYTWFPADKPNQKQREKLVHTDGIMTGTIPHQSPGTEVTVNVFLQDEQFTLQVPERTELTVTFHGRVSLFVKGLFFFTIFAALIFAVRTGLDWFNERPRFKMYGVFAAIFSLLFGLLISPMKQSFILDAVGGRKVPPFAELFLPEHLAYPVIWIAAVILIFNLNEFARIPALIAMGLTLAVFIITF